MKNKICGLLFGLMSLAVWGQSDTILIRCAFVNDDGSTTLTWETDNIENADPTLHATFGQYNIFYSTSAQPSPTLVGTEPSITTGTFTDITANANNGSIRYSINATSSPYNFKYGSINTMFLTANQMNSTTIALQWNSLDLMSYIYHGNTGYENSKYKIYRSRTSNGEADVLIGTIDSSYQSPVLKFYDYISPICEDTLTYYVEIANDYPCISRSNKAKTIVYDDEVPDKPNVRCVSTDITTQQVGITWTPSAASDVRGYVICSGEPCTTLATIEGKNSSSYTCSGCDPLNIHSLAIMSYDSCMNTSPRSDKHNNIVLSIQRPQCSNQVTLSWNQYINMEGGLAEYAVYSSNDNINFAQMTSVSSEMTSCQIGINTSLSDYFFYVVAVGNGGYNSTSNVVHLSIEAADVLDYLYIRSVSVLPSNNQIELSFFLDSTLAVEHYKLTRSSDGVSFDNIATLPYSGKGTFGYTDNLPQSAASVIYTYILHAPDVCLTDYKSSKPVSSMQLKASEVSSAITDLQWNTYNGWNAVLDYSIYRSNGSNSATTELLGLSAGSVFSDNAADMVVGGYNITYNIIATQNGYGEDGKQATASSSYASITKNTLCWIPNAFTPKGNGNNIFKPQISFIT
ncbi:MAG: hypothetical protein LBO06_04835, partial [Bacteroidales bacterium]|nr:hypothetical protein [Bacteroidales bacterium]